MPQELRASIWTGRAVLALAAAVLAAPTASATERDGEVAEECRRPAGARPQGTPVPGARGCTALDVIQFPGVMLDPVLGAIDDVATRFAKRPTTSPVRNLPRGLGRARRSAERALALLPEGAVCDGAAAARRTTQ